MNTPELWMPTISAPRTIAEAARRAEEAGWHGIAVVDSQNLAGDSYVALALAAAATERIGLGTAVTNPVTRHPAVTACAIASIQIASDGRAVLGIGRGDSALAHLGRAPARVARLEHYVSVLQRYLEGEPVPFDELSFDRDDVAPPVATLSLADTPPESRIAWTARLPKVPVEIASTGPRVIGLAARLADRVMFALGAEPERIRWGIQTAREAREKAGLDPDALQFGAYVNVVTHPDLDTARALVSGGLTTFARFAVMHGTVAGPASEAQRDVFERLHSAYDMHQHTRADSPQAGTLTADFIDRYAIVGSPDHCIERLQELASLGLGRFMIVGPSAGSDREQARVAIDRFREGILPVFV